MSGGRLGPPLRLRQSRQSAQRAVRLACGGIENLVGRMASRAGATCLGFIQCTAARRGEAHVCMMRQPGPRYAVARSLVLFPAP